MYVLGCVAAKLTISSPACSDDNTCSTALQLCTRCDFLPAVGESHVEGTSTYD